jgi:gamma-glutamylcysteine synthetase
MGEDKFKTKFPSLRRLNFGSFHSGLLPPLDKNDLFFSQIKEFPLTKQQEETEFYKDWMTHLVKLFPNVHNPIFNEVRGKSYK